MKSKLIMFALCLTTMALAQEEHHLTGSSTESREQTNAILKLSNLVESAAVEVRVFPNPSSGNFTIAAPEGAQVTVYSDLGNYVGTWVVGVEGAVVMEQMPSGVFICTIMANNERHVRRVVVL